MITEAEAQQLRAAADAVAAAVAVDDFAPEAIAPRQTAADPVPLKWNLFKRNARPAASAARERWGGR